MTSSVLRTLAPCAAIFAIAACPPAPASPENPAPDPHGWLADYAELRAYTTSSFANFEYRVRTVPIDLPALDRDTRAALTGAHTLEAAQDAIRRFVAAFHDGHFQARPADRAPPGDPAAPIAGDASWQVACDALGVKSPPPRRAPIGWTTLGDRYRAVSTLAGLDAGVVMPAPGEPGLAVLHIPIFAGTGYPALCEAAWTARHTTAACDDACQDALAEELDQRLIDAIDAALTALVASQPRALVLDVAGNGGGTEMVDAVERMVTARPLHDPPLGYIRQPHWERQFAHARDAMRAELARRDLTPAQRALVQHAEDRAEAARRDAIRPCDLSSVWRLASPTFPCSAVGRFTGYLDPGDAIGDAEIASLDTRAYFLQSSKFRVHPARWTGPLILVVDHGSASATEELAATLQDQAGAIVVGTRTFGIGCGFTEGGTRIALRHLALVVRAPDCIRYRADGSVETAGITPDRTVAARPDDDAAARASSVLRAIRERSPPTADR